jgi:UTP--glucose-1-phosphate uridylyltransferase
VGSAAPSQLAIACRYVFGPEIFAAIEKTVPGRGGELWISDSIRILINQGLPVYCLRLAGSEKRYDIGNFEGYFRAFVDFALEDEKFGYTLRQHLTRHLER